MVIEFDCACKRNEKAFWMDGKRDRVPFFYPYYNFDKVEKLAFEMHSQVGLCIMYNSGA